MWAEAPISCSVVIGLPAAPVLGGVQMPRTVLTALQHEAFEAATSVLALGVAGGALQ